jgi:predicted secreted protein
MAMAESLRSNPSIDPGTQEIKSSVEGVVELTVNWRAQQYF